MVQKTSETEEEAWRAYFINGMAVNALSVERSERCNIGISTEWKAANVSTVARCSIRDINGITENVIYVAP